MKGGGNINEFFLIRQAQKGNTDALETLIVNYYNNIFAYLVRRTGKCEIAEDLTQETFLRLAKSLATYKPTGKFAYFIFTIAVNVCNDYYRKNKLSLVYDGDIDSLSDGDIADDGAEHWANVITLKDAIDALPDMQKEVLLLRFFHDMKIKDIAQVTNAPVPTVKSRLNQGLYKLRKMLGSDDE